MNSQKNGATGAATTAARVLSPALVRAYLTDFSHSHDGAAQYAGVSIPAVQRALRGDRLDEEDTRRILDACRRRLGRARFDQFLRNWTPPPQEREREPDLSASPVIFAVAAVPVEDEPVPQPAAMPEEDPLTCKRCGQSKPVEEFAVRRGYMSRGGNAVAGGRDFYCKPCRSFVMRAASATKQANRANGHAAEPPVITAILEGSDERVPEELRDTPPAPAPLPVAAPSSRSETLMAAAVEMERLEQENAALRERLVWAGRTLGQAENALVTALDAIRALRS